MHLENRLVWIYKVDKPINLCDMQNYLSLKKRRKKSYLYYKLLTKKYPNMRI